MYNLPIFIFFFFNDTATTEIYTLSLHDALPIFQQPGPDDDEREADIEERQRVEGEGEVAERDDDPSHEHAAVLPEPAVGDDAADDRRQPHGADVVPVDRSGVLVREPERLDHAQDQEAPHPVVAEPLPHLREEERG